MVGGRARDDVPLVGVRVWAGGLKENDREREREREGDGEEKNRGNKLYCLKLYCTQFASVLRND